MNNNINTEESTWRPTLEYLYRPNGTNIISPLVIILVLFLPEMRSDEFIRKTQLTCLAYCAVSRGVHVKYVTRMTCCHINGPKGLVDRPKIT